jgi:hypothetical protein
MVPCLLCSVKMKVRSEILILQDVSDKVCWLTKVEFMRVLDTLVARRNLVLLPL